VETAQDIEMKLLLEAIYLTYHYDFRSYAMASVRRRLNQALTLFGCSDLTRLQDRVLREPETFTRLLQFLTIQVSDMFRDPSYFRSLRAAVAPILKTYPSLKVWVAGCSTGEEVYSLAILLKEEGLLDRTLIYATDINGESLRAAEAGIYPLERMAKFSINYTRAGGRGSLSSYYLAAYNAATFDKSLRSRIVFSDHSLSTDSVFSEVHFISCRNVLIYFDKNLQDRAIGLFRDSLCRRGFLGLGSKENLRFVQSGSSFSEFVRDERIYQRF
jgi:chemotaxis protein methyltransferase CheR